jgi:aspartyl-tRNA(Asn)/glutamyl-tRNA(Gln) amidotransferase subunit C
MIITESIKSYIEELTGIELSEDKLDFVNSRLESILDYIGYSETEAESEQTTVDVRQTGIDDNLIKYLEELSRLQLTPDEEERSKTELNKILKYIDMLDELDTENVEPMSHPFAYTNNFREDEVISSSDRETILKNAPQQKDGCFKVPTTVE